MKVGSKWQLFVPPWLGYREHRFRHVPPNSVLIYEIELLSIEPPSALTPKVEDNSAEENESGTGK
jgi:hypothetical protein